MAKFLRFIFNLLLVCYIVAALALFVPPLVGVTTAVTVEGTAGNQELGSVNYAWRTPLGSLQAGDEILVSDDSSVNVYTVQAVDTENSVIAASDGTEVAVRTYVYKVLLTVPFIGYIAIGLQTTEGMIILGAAAGTLLILCILTGVWCRRRKIKRMEEDEEDLLDEEDTEFFQNLASQKRESDARAEADFTARQEALQQTIAVPVNEPAPDEEYEELPEVQEEAVQKDSADDSEVNEILPEEGETLNPEIPSEEEDAAEPEAADGESAEEEPADRSDSERDDQSLSPETDTEKTEVAEDTEAGSADEPEKTEAVPAEKPLPVNKQDEILETDEEMAVERAVETGNIPGVQAALEAALDTQQIQRHVRRNEVFHEPEKEPEPLASEEIELAMPVHTVDEYLQKAYADGEDPRVHKDELTGVTYVDYSDCI